MKVYHDGAAMTSPVTDAMLILTRMLEYYQIADNAPNAIERERLRLLRLRLLTELHIG